MDYSQYSVEDFLLDDRFRKWIINPDKDDHVFWENWLARNPSRANDLIEAKNMLLHLSMKDHRLGADEADALWNNLEKEIDLIEDIPSETKVIPISSESILERSKKEKRPDYQWMRIAALLLLLVVASVILVKLNTPSEPPVAAAPQLVEKATESGMKSQITLKDGTLVVLNSASKLSYFPSFNDKSRDVYLEGEAYFDVAKDSSRPFNVYTGDVVTTALGTAFNINGYQDNGNGIAIALVEGKVSVQKAQAENKTPAVSNEGHILLPGHRATYDPESKAFSLSDFDLKQETAWKEGNLLFVNAEAAEVFTRIERWYGVKMIPKNASDKKLNYSAEFKNQNIHQVLTSLSFTLAFDYEIKDSEILITYKNP